MKTTQTLVSCYEDFLDHCSSCQTADRLEYVKEYLLFEKIGFFDEMPFGCGLIDYSSGKFLYITHNSEEILGYGKEDFELGIELYNRNIMTEDRKIFSEHIFPDILRFLFTIPHAEYENYRFSFTFHYFRKDGCRINLLQHCTYFLPDPFGRPLLNRVIFSDITCFKADERMSLTISCHEKGKGFTPVFFRRYMPQSKSCISNRELEILKLSLKGLSSKLIADKLFLSIFTVKNHKRNMMEKTESRNMPELINYALKNKLLI